MIKKMVLALLGSVGVTFVIPAKAARTAHYACVKGDLRHFVRDVNHIEELIALPEEIEKTLEEYERYNRVIYLPDTDLSHGRDAAKRCLEQHDSMFNSGDIMSIVRTMAIKTSDNPLEPSASADITNKVSYVAQIIPTKHGKGLKPLIKTYGAGYGWVRVEDDVARELQMHPWLVQAAPGTTESELPYRENKKPAHELRETGTEPLLISE